MNSSLVFDRISRHWRTEIDDSHDFAIIRNDTISRSSFSDSWVFESDYNRAGALKRDLMSRYSDCSVEEVFGGTEVDTSEGVCYAVHHECALPGRPGPGPDPRILLLSDLTLIRGIGRKKESELKKRGYMTIRDLLGHRSYRCRAEAALAVISDARPEEITRMVTRGLSPSHPLTLLTSGLYNPSDFVFLDLETMGFFSRPIILFGIALISGDRLVVHQFLVREMDEELPALIALKQYLGPRNVLVTFNGKTFDIPYLKERYSYYGEYMRMGNIHFDLLHAARRAWRTKLPDCRLGTLEQKIFGMKREHDVPSAMVPEFYETYLKTGNPGPLVPVVGHNRQDVITLARLLALFQEGTA
jgi:uncharacterized protein YprB with RNaseH-like and TPR domain